MALDGDDFVCLRREGARPHPSSPSPLNLGSSPLGDWRADDPDVERTVLASGPAARALHVRARSEWELLTAAALDGVRAESLAIGVEYVKNRWAFGVPIGWFQAIQHRLADVATAGDGAQLLVYEAAWARDEGRPEADPARGDGVPRARPRSRRRRRGRACSSTAATDTPWSTTSSCTSGGRRPGRCRWVIRAASTNGWPTCCSPTRPEDRIMDFEVVDKLADVREAAARWLDENADPEWAEQQARSGDFHTPELQRRLARRRLAGRGSAGGVRRDRQLAAARDRDHPGDDQTRGPPRRLGLDPADLPDVARASAPKTRSSGTYVG